MKKKLIDQEVIFGIHPILELIRAKKRHLLTIYTTQPTPKAWSLIEKDLPKSVQIQFVQRDVLTRIAGTPDHQSIVALATPFKFRKKFFDPTREKFLIMLDGVQDPRNLGAILRSSHCTGVQGVIMIQQKSSALTGIALKSSAGLAEYLEIYQAPSARAAIAELKKAGYSIYMAALGGSDATQVAYKLPLCIVIGSEDLGISKDILQEGIRVTLPQKELRISYNASVAAGIFLFFIATNKKII